MIVKLIDLALPLWHFVFVFTLRRHYNFLVKIVDGGRSATARGGGG